MNIAFSSLSSLRWIIPAGILGFTLIAFLFNRKRVVSHYLWVVSSVFSLVCLIGIIWTLFVVVESSQGDTESEPITSKVLLNDILRSFPKHDNEPIEKTSTSLPTDYAKLIYIPTGLFIQSMEFTSSNNVYVTGYIWQKYLKDFPADIPQEIVFPEGEETTFSKAYQTKIKDVNLGEDIEVVGWYFVTTLRQSFYYDRYPFDTQDIWLRMWPKSLDHHVILVPDLDSYSSLAKKELPGLERDFVLENWDVRETYFSYWQNKYNTDFGLGKNVHLGETPELYFNIIISRNTINALLAYAAPPLITALMVFGILLMSTLHKEQMVLAGWNSVTALGFCASLLFVIIFAQINMRNQLNAPGVIYLEYLYFIVYFAILLVSLNSILFIIGEKFWVIQWEDNLIPKTLYWPLLLGTFFVITWITFL